MGAVQTAAAPCKKQGEAYSVSINSIDNTGVYYTSFTSAGKRNYTGQIPSGKREFRLLA
jgi:hypothetical protein